MAVRRARTRAFPCAEQPLTSPVVLVPLHPLAASLALALARAPATEPPPVAEAAGTPPAAVAKPEGEPAPKDPSEEEDNWLDVGHAFVEHRIFAPILRLDRFFSDERELDADRARSFVRWRNEVRFTEDASGPSFATGIRANLRLSGLNRQLRRLRLVIEGETRDQLRTLFPRRQAGGSAAEEEDTFGAANAGLRFYFLETIVSHADLGAGVLTRIPPGLYTRLRIRAAIPVGRLFLARSFAAGFWRTDTLFGTSAGLDLERPLAGWLVSRLSGFATLTERSQGIEWSSELALLALIDRHKAAQLGFAVNGSSDPRLAPDNLTRPPDLERLRLYTRLRRDLYRSWIFVELEPELAWPWTLERGRHRAWGVSFRLEVQFQGTEARPRPPAPPPPEPKDPEPKDPEPPDPPPQDPLPKEPGPG